MKVMCKPTFKGQHNQLSHTVTHCLYSVPKSPLNLLSWSGNHLAPM